MTSRTGPAEPAWLRRLSGTLVLVEVTLMAMFLLGILLLILATIGQRYLPATNFVWLAELARFMVVWLTFLGIGPLLTRNEHIGLHLRPKFIGPKASFCIDVLASALVGLVCIVTAAGSQEFINRQGALLSPALQIPVGWLYGAAVAGLWLAALHAALKIVNQLLGTFSATPISAKELS